MHRGLPTPADVSCDRRRESAEQDVSDCHPHTVHVISPCGRYGSKYRWPPGPSPGRRFGSSDGTRPSARAPRRRAPRRAHAPRRSSRRSSTRATGGSGPATRTAVLASPSPSRAGPWSMRGTGHDARLLDRLVGRPPAVADRVLRRHVRPDVSVRPRARREPRSRIRESRMSRSRSRAWSTSNEPCRGPPRR